MIGDFHLVPRADRLGRQPRPRDVLDVRHAVELGAARQTRRGVVVILHEEVHGAVRVEELFAPLRGCQRRDGLWSLVRTGVVFNRTVGRTLGLPEGHAYGTEGQAGLLHERVRLGHECVVVVVAGVLFRLRAFRRLGLLGLPEGHADGTEGEADLLQELLGAAHDRLGLVAVALRVIRADRHAPVTPAGATRPRTEGIIGVSAAEGPVGACARVQGADARRGRRRR